MPSSRFCSCPDSGLTYMPEWHDNGVQAALSQKSSYTWRIKAKAKAKAKSEKMNHP